MSLYVIFTQLDVAVDDDDDGGGSATSTAQILTFYYHITCRNPESRYVSTANTRIADRSVWHASYRQHTDPRCRQRAQASA